MGVIHLACAAERNYLQHSAAMLASALRHRGSNELTVHYLHGPRFPRRGRRRLAGMVLDMGGTISFVRVPDALVAGFPTRDFTRKATWYRLFLPELLPDVGRLLYLDVDALVRDDLSPLWETDLEGNYVGAVTNVFQSDHLARTQKIGIKPRDYFNAGVLLLDLEPMRADGCSRALSEFAADNPDLIGWRDQDTLNAVLGPRRLPLHPRWNCMLAILRFPQSIDVFGAEVVEEARTNPAIRHFEGPGSNKPWHPDADPADRALYLAARERTPWPRIGRLGG